MKMKLSIMVAAILAVMVAASSFGVALAQDEAEQPEPLLRVLAVKVPNSAQAGEPVAIEVTERRAGTPVEGADVYALGWPLRRAGNSTLANFGVNVFWLSLGETDGNGEVTHSFDRAGRFLIVATTEGHVPGLARLNVKPNISGRLKIESPGRVEDEQPVDIVINEKASGEAVSGADIWLVKMPIRLFGNFGDLSATDLRALLGLMREGNASDILSRRGQHLGQSGGDGVLTHSFTEVGKFLLIATKDGHSPDVKPIAVVSNKRLSVEAPRMAGVDEDVTLTVKTKELGTSVGGVDLYALSPGNSSSIATLLPRLRDEADSLREKVVEIGEHLGTTSDAGELEYRFSKKGLYVVIGFKDGYVPGFTVIYVGEFLRLGDRLPWADGFEGLFPSVDGFERLMPDLFGEDGLRQNLDRLREAAGERGWWR